MAHWHELEFAGEPRPVGRGVDGVCDNGPYVLCLHLLLCCSIKQHRITACIAVLSSLLFVFWCLLVTYCSATFVL